MGAFTDQEVLPYKILSFLERIISQYLSLAAVFYERSVFYEKMFAFCFIYYGDELRFCLCKKQSAYCT